MDPCSNNTPRSTQRPGRRGVEAAVTVEQESWRGQVLEQVGQEEQENVLQVQMLQ